MNKVIETVTNAIKHRSATSRAEYIRLMKSLAHSRPAREDLSCCNIAHGLAAQESDERAKLSTDNAGSIAIITAYNDMLSAHQPYGEYPQKIKQILKPTRYTSQVAAGVPAMCDGITQGNPGMELSLFSRDLIAMASAIGLTHAMFEGIICLGICDKIVPGLLIGALRFGYLPTVFIPSGPMPSGIPNKQKALARQYFAEGKIDRKELLASETQSYHSAGTCTFYGTANSNEILLEAMGLQLPGSSFINPTDPLRPALTEHAVLQFIKKTPLEKNYLPLYETLDEKALVNAMVALLASGGSTNHTMHLLAIGRAAGIRLEWSDFEKISSVVPLLAKIYPNGHADVNDFQHAGGIAKLFRSLIEGDLLHTDIKPVACDNFLEYTQAPQLINNEVRWSPHLTISNHDDIIRPVANPFAAEGGIKLLRGNLGTAIIKTSAVDPEHLRVKAPAKIYQDQQQFKDDFKTGALNQDFVAVIMYQGPKANGMPELHQLTPILSSLMKQGFNVALVTDGRMSGASGTVPAAIHVTPEAKEQGNIGKIREGDIVIVDAIEGVLSVELSEAELAKREIVPLDPLRQSDEGFGRELFALFRNNVTSADQGATVFDNLK